MKPYPAYKESGIEWIGDYPKDWKLKRLKFVTKINPSRPPDMPEDLQCVFIPMEAMNSDGTFDQFQRRPLSELRSGFTCFARDDVIFAKITPCFENGKGALLSDLDSKIGFGSTEFHVLRAVKGRTTSKFLYYLTSSGEFRRTGEAFMQGVAGQKRVTNDFVRDYVTAVPSVDEQESIADYLDRKTAQIDDLIAKKERMIELLKEERTAIINQAVTRGLDLNAELKDSGINWLGKIPTHWSLKRIKHIGTIRYGLGEPPEYANDGLPFVRATDIKRGKIDLEFVRKINPSDVPWNRHPQLENAEILVVRSGAYTGDSAIVTPEIAGSIAGYDMVLTVTKAESRFVAWALLSDYLLEGQIYQARMRAAQLHLNAEELGGSFILMPPLIEQSAIADFLDHKTTQIDEQVSREEESIELLKEFRTALISEVVTGKIDVRDSR